MTKLTTDTRELLSTAYDALAQPQFYTLRALLSAILLLYLVYTGHATVEAVLAIALGVTIPVQGICQPQ